MPKEKLVRDNMPAICAERPGYSPMTFRTAMIKERLPLLIAKIKEEVDELDASLNDLFGKKPEMVEEFADIKQCYLDLMKLTTTNDAEVEEVRLRKEADRGGFNKFYVWDGKR